MSEVGANGVRLPADPTHPLLGKKAQALRPYLAVRFRDMMIAGCFGLLAAAMELPPEHGEATRASLEGKTGQAPWVVQDCWDVRGRGERRSPSC